MIHGKRKESFDTGLYMGREYQKRRVEEMQYVGGTQSCSKDVRGKLLPRGINQARDVVSSLDAHVTCGGLCYRVLGIKTKGEDCVKCPERS